VATSQIGTRGPRLVTLERARALTLDDAGMQQLLKDAPLESEISSTVVNGIWLFKNGFEPAGSSILLDLADRGITRSVALPSASMSALLIGHSPLRGAK